MPQPVKIGKKTRMSYAKIKEVAQMPHLLEIQNNSYKWFIEEGLKEVFEDISPINDYAGNLVLEFIDYSLSDSPKYGQEECKERDVTYAAPLRVKARLVNKETGEVKEQEVFMGDFPLMTEKGTFIYNGAERVVVTQLVRSPGPYYAVAIDKSNNSLYSTTIIPNRGAWLEYETDSNEIISVRVDRTRKQPVTTLLRAFGFGTDEEIIELFGEDDRLLKTLERDTTNNYEEGLKEIYKKLRPAEPPTVESAKALFNSLFFDAKRYDLAKVGSPLLKMAVPGNELIGKIAGKVDVGLVAFCFTIIALLFDLAPQKEVIARVPWNTILMIAGAGMLIAVAVQAGTIDALSAWIGSNVPTALIPLAFSFVGAFMSFFSSTTGVVAPALFPLIPGLAAATGLNPAALFACTILGAQSSAISPFSSGGSLILGSCGNEEDRNHLFNRLLFVAVPISVICCAAYNLIVAVVL